MCLLRELYGAGVEKLRIEHQTVVVSVWKIKVAELFHASKQIQIFTLILLLYILLLLCVFVSRLLQKRKLKLTQLPVIIIWK